MESLVVDTDASPIRTVAKFSDYQAFAVAILAFLQFTIILDFMIISPLGALLMPALQISPAQFGTVVSVYAFSAGASGFFAAGFADRFDRKKLLMFFYTGFLIGTLFCGLANSYHLLLAARMVTGVFGGVIGSVVLAISTDLFPLEMRGRVMGYLQTAFAGSQILGLPAGLYFSNLWGWHAPFYMIVLIGSVVGVIIWFKLKPVDEHLQLQTEHNVLLHLRATILNPKYTLAFAVTMLLSTGGYMLMPFGSDFTVHNLGISLDQLPLIYLITGIAAIFIGPIAGKASDRFGKFNVFAFGSCLSVIMVSIYTNLSTTPLALVILVNVFMFVAIFSRMIPSQALISAIPAAGNRGSFMSISSCLQQLSGGLASIVAGLIVIEQEDKTLAHFNVLGFVVIFTALISIVMMYYIHKSVPERVKHEV